MLRLKIFPMDFFFGIKNFRYETEPIRTVRTPASVNRSPAYKICAAVSLPAICMKEYPSLMHGKALPHKTQQIIAPIQTTIVFFIKLSFIVFPYNFLPEFRVLRVKMSQKRMQASALLPFDPSIMQIKV